MCDNEAFENNDTVVIAYSTAHKDEKAEIKDSAKPADNIDVETETKGASKPSENPDEKETKKAVKKPPKMIIPEVEVFSVSSNIRTASVSLRTTIDFSITPTHSSHNVSSGGTTTKSATRTCTIINSPMPPKSPSEDEEVILYKRRWIILAIFSLISMVNAAMWISLSSISSIVKEYYNVSHMSANWLAMIFSCTYFFVVLSVYVLNKFGLKATICIGAGLNALGSVMKFIGRNRGGFALAVAGNGLGGLAQCFILFVPPTLAATWFGEKERGMASAIGMLMNMLGVALGYIMGGTMVPNTDDYEGSVKDGFFTLLLSQAVGAIILAFLSVALIKNAPTSPPSMSQVLLQEKKWEKKMHKKFQRDIELLYYHVSNEASASTMEFENRKDPGFNMDEFVVGFRKSFRLLWVNKSFHMVAQSYGIFFGLYLAINTLLNHACTESFPGKEKEISLMGCVSVIFGLTGMFFGGMYIDKTHRYKFISSWDFVLCAVTFAGFTLLSEYAKNLPAVFASFCAFGLFSYPFMSIGLEYAAEVAFPVSEGVTSSILLLLANTYGIILTLVGNIVIDRMGVLEFGCFSVVLYLCGAVIVAKAGGELKRLRADRDARSDVVRNDIVLEPEIN